VRGLEESKLQDPCDTVEPYTYKLVRMWHLNPALSERAATGCDTVEPYTYKLVRMWHLNPALSALRSSG